MLWHDSAGRYAVPASVRESRLKADWLISPKDFHVLSLGLSLSKPSGFSPAAAVRRV